MLVEKNGYVCDYDRPVAVTFYVNDEGLREGVYRTYHINDKKERIGKFQIFHYSAGELDGPFEAYNVDGELMEEGYYKSGKLHGTFREYVGGKLIVRATYKDDLLDGKFTRWRDVDKGTLEYNIYYKDGVPQQMMGFDENSMIQKVIYYDGGIAVEESEYKRTADHVYFCKRTRDYYTEEIVA
jgi:antitoxin component YwqK of YwqJK toxin-antitoxin module